jgi:tetratricopeptide (TPR) repeat protein
MRSPTFAPGRASQLRRLGWTAVLATVVALWAGEASADDAALCENRTNTDPDISISACNRLLAQKNSIRPVVLTYMGLAYQRKYQYDRAIELYDEAIKLDPNQAFAWEARADVLYRKGELEKARQDADHAISLNPKAVGAYNVRAEIDWDKHDLEACLVDYNKLVDVAPEQPASYHNRALCLRDRGEYDKALADLDKSIQMKPDFAEAWDIRGDVFRLMGDLDRALQDQNKAVQLAPRSHEAYLMRGETYRYRGDLDLALADYDKSIAVRPDISIPARTGRGLTFEKKGDLVRAKAEFEKATTVNSTDKSYLTRNALETAKARLAALASGAAQPVIPAVPAKPANPTSIPTPAIVVPPPVSPSRAAPASARRVALVFGNSHYKSVPELANPSHDANAVAQSLRAIGFTSVTLDIDDSHEKMLAALRKFANEATGADWALVYYAGHGIEMGGVNYLIPVDADLKTDRDVQFATIPFNQVMASMEGARKLRLVLLDACRDNPFEAQMQQTPPSEAVAVPTAAGGRTSSRSIGRGLAEVNVTGATLVVFAAKQGRTALDGDGRDSPFAVAVIQRIATPGVEINKVFRLVRDDVMEATAGRQEPYTYGSLPGSEDLFFVGKN